mmetsp:Transcript_56345/g.103392  ORF Transcript_56345/g.103392 Transcript_56345/m.103392 type:complete len:136 (-) Transcript_56345:44-451(-)
MLAGICAFIALLRAAPRAAKAEADPVPDFLKCDGWFVPTTGETHHLVTWCGWLRFDGHGCCTVQKSEDDLLGITGEWDVQIDVVHITLLLDGKSSHAAAELFLRRGTVEDTVDVSLTADGALACNYTFVPEEHDD